ncbi:MAG: hypothetical protein AAF560_28150 [Acidobacteriota bacterium]
MSRLTALLGKELRHHGIAGLVLLTCVGGGYVLLVFGALMSSETVSVMQVHAAFLGLFVLLAAIVLGHRLVVAEYFSRTQLFLEALPLRRWEVVALKFSLGLGFLLLMSALSLAVTALVAWTREPLDAWFLTIVATRTAAYVFFLWSFLFAMGMVGRFRIPIYLALLLLFVVLDDLTQLELQRFGPIALLDNNSLPFERETLPWRAVLETLGLGAAWTAIAFTLALIQEGSVAEALAKRMSQKEKALVGILFVAFMLAIVFLEERRDKEPYAFPQQEILASVEVPVEILYVQPERLGDAKLLMSRLEHDLASLQQTFDWPELPAVRIAYQPSLDGSIYDRAELVSNDGILIRANFRQTGTWDPRAFAAYVIGETLDEATEDRARFEPKAWLRDGFALWWAGRSRSPGDPAELCSSKDSPDRRTLLRALWASRQQPLDAEVLRRWLRTRERHGEAVAEALAASGLWVLERGQGEAKVLALARGILGRQPTKDIRELFYEWRQPMPKAFKEAVGLDWSEFLDDWASSLERWRAQPACAELLARLPEVAAELEVERGDGSVRHLTYRVDAEPPWPQGTLVTLLHKRLTPFDEPLERIELRRREHLWPGGQSQASWRLPGFYGEGSRAFLALEVESQLLGCPLRLIAQRREIR